MCAEKLTGDMLIQLMLVNLRFVSSQFHDDGIQIILTHVREGMCKKTSLTQSWKINLLSLSTHKRDLKDSFLKLK